MGNDLKQWRDAMNLSTPIPITNHIWTDETAPLVTVKCITYNQAAYISEAIESFLMQKTTFPVQILVHDDASNDGTANIILAYAKKYPNIFTTIIQKENVTSKGGRAKHRARKQMLDVTYGKYIALCEGDDYWIDPLKLQKQVDLLKRNKNLSAVHSHCYYVSKEGMTISDTTSLNLPIEITLVHLIKRGTIIRTPTFMFSREIYDDNWLINIMHLPAGDLPLFMKCASKGPIGLISECTAAYRVNTGITSAYDELIRAKNLLEFLPLAEEFSSTEIEKAAIHQRKWELTEYVLVGCLTKKGLYSKIQALWDSKHILKIVGIKPIALIIYKIIRLSVKANTKWSFHL